jgi:hypothetical protein
METNGDFLFKRYFFIIINLSLPLLPGRAARKDSLIVTLYKDTGYDGKIKTEFKTLVCCAIKMTC